MPDDRPASRGPSLTARLVAVVVLLSLALVGAASAGAAAVARDALADGLDEAADARAAVLAPLVASQGPDAVRTDPSAQLLDPAGRVLAASPVLGDDPLLTPAQVDRTSSGPLALTVSPSPPPGASARVAPAWQVRAEQVRTADGPAVLVVAVDRSGLDLGLERARPALLAVAAALALATALLAALAVRWALRPVGRLVALASRASADGDLPVPPGRDHVARLATTLNAVLARMRSSVTRERAFVEGAAHALRTPLAALRGEVELARTSRTYDGLQDSLSSAAHEVSRLGALTDDLLLVAREGAAADEAGTSSSAEPSGSALRPTDLRALVPAELARLAPLVPRTALSIDDSGVGGVTALVVGPDAVWQRVLANLVRNAGQAGAGEAVVTLSTTADEVSLVLDDDGPGFDGPDDDRAGGDARPGGPAEGDPGGDDGDEASARRSAELADALFRGEARRGAGGAASRGTSAAGGAGRGPGIDGARTGGAPTPGAGRAGPAGGGLGLAIVDALVRARRGAVVLGASPDGGARVAVTVPLARPAAVERDDVEGHEEG